MPRTDPKMDAKAGRVKSRSSVVRMIRGKRIGAFIVLIFLSELSFNYVIKQPLRRASHQLGQNGGREPRSAWLDSRGGCPYAIRLVI